MDRNLILAFDVGGTQIKAAAVQGGEILPRTVSHYDSHADRDASGIVAHFVSIARDLVSKAGGAPSIDGIGLAFPGPFDYENGICLIRGLGKFESLYGKNVGRLLEETIAADESLRPILTPAFRIAFENDAALFGLGEARYGEARGAAKAVCLTIGTGLGSCFLEHGRLVKRGDGIPENGWLFDLPNPGPEGGNADDNISRRGILELASRLEPAIPERRMDVREYARLAYAGDDSARSLFAEFGRRMAAILAPALRAYAPDVIVIGGQISKSGGLFLPEFIAGLDIETGVRTSRDTLSSTFLGIYDWIGTR